MSLSIFLALPAPFKAVVILVGGLFFVGFKFGAELQPLPAPVPVPARVQVVPAEAPAKVIAAVPVQPAKAVKSMMITVNSDGSFNVGGAKLTEAELLKKLNAIAAANPKAQIELKADALTPYQMVVSAVKICKKAGLTHVTFASKPDKQ